MDEYRVAASNRLVEWQDLDSVRRRRKYTRRGVQLDARVRTGARDLLATAENISPGGAFLRVDLPVETEDLVATIHLPHGRGLHVHGHPLEEHPLAHGREVHRRLAHDAFPGLEGVIS